MVVFSDWGRIRKARFDNAGQKVRRGMPEGTQPGPLGASPEPVDHLEEAWGKPADKAPSYDVPGAAAELGERLRAMESGIRELPSEHLFIESEEEQRRMYARSAAIGMLGCSYWYGGP